MAAKELEGIRAPVVAELDRDVVRGSRNAGRRYSTRSSLPKMKPRPNRKNGSCGDDFRAIFDAQAPEPADEIPVLEQPEQVNVRDSGVLLEGQGGDRAALDARADAPADLPAGLDGDVDVDDASALLLLVEPRGRGHVHRRECTERVHGALRVRQRERAVGFAGLEVGDCEDRVARAACRCR